MATTSTPSSSTCGGINTECVINYIKSPVVHLAGIILLSMGIQLLRYKEVFGLPGSVGYSVSAFIGRHLPHAAFAYFIWTKVSWKNPTESCGILGTTITYLACSFIC